MKPALLTLLPMALVALFTMVAGERLARRSDESRLSYDEKKLFVFDEAFRSEVERLDQLYLDHLKSLVILLEREGERAAKNEAQLITGIQKLVVFKESGSKKVIDLKPASGTTPELILEGGRQNLLGGNAVVVLPKDLLERSPSEDFGWQATPNGRFVVCWYRPRPFPEQVVTILLKLDDVRLATEEYLAQWASLPSEPLASAGQRIRIEPAWGEPIFTLGGPQDGASAAILPVTSLFGTWRIRVWDGVETRSFHDLGVLSVAALLAFLFLVSGFLLFRQKTRSLKLAAERVSFVNRVSHELGTPLTNLSLNLGLAEDAVNDNEITEVRKRLSLVGEETSRLSRLVANVLTFSRKEREILELKPTRCQPDEVIRRVAETFRPALSRRGIALEPDWNASIPVTLDPDALEQITGNLLSNIEKYAADGKWARLEVSWEKDFLTVTLRDRGPGIPARQQDRIFLPFARVRSETSEGSSGTGLGLAISRELAECMGGSLKLAGSDSSGSTFLLTVPAPTTNNEDKAPA